MQKTIATALLAATAGLLGVTAQPTAANETQAREAAPATQKSTTPARAAVAEAAINQAYGWAPGRSGYKYPRAGWSVAHGKRMARKRRNVLRNRRNHRG